MTLICAAWVSAGSHDVSSHAVQNLAVSSPEIWLADQAVPLFNQHVSPVWCRAVNVHTVDTTIIWNILPLFDRSKGGVQRYNSGVHWGGVKNPKTSARDLGQHSCQWLWPEEAFLRPIQRPLHWTDPKAKGCPDKPQLRIWVQLCCNPHSGHLVQV